MRQTVKRVLARGGFRVERLAADERLIRHGYDPRNGPPAADLALLTPENPRLVALQDAYAHHESAYASSIWAAAQSSTEADLRYFRGDNLYLWQYTRSPRHNAYRTFILATYVQTVDDLGLLGTRVDEDGDFGCFTFDFDGLPTLSRDLLDSVNEIAFLNRHTDLMTSPDFSVVDVGAGYGRLAHRVLASAPNVAAYWCLDAVARSTFLCEYYLAHRGMSDRAVVVPLHEIESAEAGLPRSGLDLAVNIHSFSEMPRAAIRAWLELLAGREVPRLLVVPNERDEVFSREPDGSRLDCGDLFTESGYELLVKEPTILDAGVRDVLDIHDYFLLYGRAR